MRKTYHLCLSSHDEVMFRSNEDYIRGFNSFACAILETDSIALGDGIMSDHEHFCVRTDNPVELFKRTRYAYTRYFNSKYKRTGRLGEKEPFSTELDGVKHITAALSYVYRQGLHHGLSATSFGYRHNSVNSIFMKDLGKSTPDLLMNDLQKHSYVPRSFPGNPGEYRMTSDGLLLREDIIDTRYVESLFISPRNFIYQINRLSGEEWENELKEEKSTTGIVNLESMEKQFDKNAIAKMLINENGRYDKRKMNDIELCELIDTIYLQRYYPHRNSIYELSTQERAELAGKIVQDYNLMRNNPRKYGPTKYFTKNQLKRCLVL